MSIKAIADELRVLGETDLADQVNQVVARGFTSPSPKSKPAIIDQDDEILYNGKSITIAGEAVDGDTDDVYSLYKTEKGKVIIGSINNPDEEVLSKEDTKMIKAYLKKVNDFIS